MSCELCGKEITHRDYDHISISITRYYRTWNEAKELLEEARAKRSRLIEVLEGVYSETELIDMYMRSDSYNLMLCPSCFIKVFKPLLKKDKVREKLIFEGIVKEDEVK